MTTNKMLSRIENGVGALGVASGQAATAYAIQNIAKNGDNIVSSTHLYGGTYNQFKNPLNDMGIEVRFVDPEDPQNFINAADEKTRAFFGEVLPNPSFKVFPLNEVAELGKAEGIPLIVDNTAAPIICKPIDHGATVVVHSTTKYIGGHGTSIGGIIIDSGKLDWEKFPDRQEGHLTSLRSALVRGKNIAKVLETLDVLEYIKLSFGEQRSNGSQKSYIQANVYEAIVGAIYMDGGYEKASKFIFETVIPTLDGIIEEQAHIDSKSHLQEIAQERFNLTPTYHLQKESGPDHNKQFEMGVFFFDKLIAISKEIGFLNIKSSSFLSILVF